MYFSVPTSSHRLGLTASLLPSGHSHDSNPLSHCLSLSPLFCVFFELSFSSYCPNKQYSQSSCHSSQSFNLSYCHAVPVYFLHFSSLLMRLFPTLSSHTQTHFLTTASIPLMSALLAANFPPLLSKKCSQKS